ncbi:hypothetical protein [Geobacter sulfurreducens]|jgi:hypothetical protein|nr:hypothetical protein [Geobacter sulfurreducens]
MKPSRMALYIAIALLAALVAYAFLVKEPHPDWPINIIHMLFRH